MFKLTHRKNGNTNEPDTSKDGEKRRKREGKSYLNYLIVKGPTAIL
jgi:hypothetical protein